MATYTIYADTSDGRITSTNATYSTARETGGTRTASTADTDASVGQTFSSKNNIYNITYLYLSFDTSSVSGTASSATLSLYSGGDLSDTDFTINARAYNWGATLETTDWVTGANLSTYTLRASISTVGGISTAAYTDFTSESTFKSNIGSPVRLLLCSSRVEGNNSPTGFESVNFYLADQTGTAQDPKLTIVDDAAAAAVEAVSALMAPRIPVERPA